MKADLALVRDELAAALLAFGIQRQVTSLQGKTITVILQILRTMLDGGDGTQN